MPASAAGRPNALRLIGPLRRRRSRVAAELSLRGDGRTFGRAAGWRSGPCRVGDGRGDELGERREAVLDARGSCASSVEPTSMTPQSRPATVIGASTVARTPNCPTRRASVVKSPSDCTRSRRCPDGCVVVGAEAISSEGGDLLDRAGVTPPAVPHIVGYAGAGTVSEIAAWRRGTCRGDRVVALNKAGSDAAKPP
jgi:hypothetical protein